MRTAWIESREALRLRLIQPQQVDTGEPEGEMPPYMESLLAHAVRVFGARSTPAAG
jgi:hypothetical protein